MNYKTQQKVETIAISISTILSFLAGIYAASQVELVLLTLCTINVVLGLVCLKLAQNNPNKRNLPRIDTKPSIGYKNVLKVNSKRFPENH